MKSVKGELKGARLKNSAAEVGSNIVEGIGAMIGTSRVKRQQQEIDRLNAENAALHEQIGTLNCANREEKAGTSRPNSSCRRSSTASNSGCPTRRRSSAGANTAATWVSRSRAPARLSP